MGKLASIQTKEFFYIWFLLLSDRALDIIVQMKIVLVSMATVL